MEPDARYKRIWRVVNEDPTYEILQYVAEVQNADEESGDVELATLYDDVTKKDRFSDEAAALSTKEFWLIIQRVDRDQAGNWYKPSDENAKFHLNTTGEAALEFESASAYSRFMMAGYNGL